MSTMNALRAQPLDADSLAPQQRPQHSTAPTFPAPPSQIMMEAPYLYPLMSQIEFYFSAGNLAKDNYLQNQLNSPDHFGAVEIEMICNFPKVRQLHASIRSMGHLPPQLAPTADPVLIRVALQYSSLVTVSHDGRWIVLNDYRTLSEKVNSVPVESEEPKMGPSVTSSPSSQATGSSSLGVPTHPLPPAATSAQAVGTSTSSSKRNTVIVRDLPSSVTEEQILKVFSTENITPKEAHPDVGNTWFITFETENDAMAVLAATRNREIEGVPVLGRLKTDTRPQPPVMPLPQPMMQAFSEGGTSVQSAVSNGSSSMPPMGHLFIPPAQAPMYSMPMQQQQQQQQQQHQYHSQVMSYAYYPGYAMPMGPISLQNLMAMRMQQQQQQYFQGYRNPGYFPQPMQVQNRGHPPKHSGNPPPHVFLHPNQKPAVSATISNQKRNQKNKNKKTGKQKEQQSQGATHQTTSSIPPAAKGSEKLPQLRSSESKTKKKGGVDGSMHKKVATQKQQQQQHGTNKKKSQTKPNIDLGAENFPALGGIKVPLNKSGTANLPVSGGYAQALLKKAVRPAATSSLTSNSPGLPSTYRVTSMKEEAMLDEVMTKLAFSAGETELTAYDEW